LTALNLKSGATTVRVIAAFREDSTLRDAITLRDHTKDYLTLPDGAEVRHASHLKVYYLSPTSTVAEKDYRFSRVGHLMLTKRQAGNPEIFGWDDVFVMSGLREAFTYYSVISGFPPTSRILSITRRWRI